MRRITSPLMVWENGAAAIAVPYTAVAMYDFPVLLGPTKMVSGFRSTEPFAMGPKFLTEMVSMAISVVENWQCILDYQRASV